jgi:hypothetical protein
MTVANGQQVLRLQDQLPAGVIGTNAEAVTGLGERRTEREAAKQQAANQQTVNQSPYGMSRHSNSLSRKQLDGFFAVCGPG